MIPFIKIGLALVSISDSSFFWVRAYLMYNKFEKYSPTELSIFLTISFASALICFLVLSTWSFLNPKPELNLLFYSMTFSGMSILIPIRTMYSSWVFAVENFKMAMLSWFFIDSSIIRIGETSPIITGFLGSLMSEPYYSFKHKSSSHIRILEILEQWDFSQKMLPRNSFQYFFLILIM